MIEPTATGDRSPPDVVAAHLPSLPGYEIVAELGRGGMGVVYKARQLSSDRLVALKLIRDGALASAQDRARFRIEAEASSRVRHPNVVEIIEVGEHQGRPYFAMEFVDGGSLDQHLTGQPLPAPLAAQLISKLASAVQHAHDQHIVHRDLKPANVLVSGGVLSGESYEAAPLTTHPLTTHQPKITDFGLAKRLDSDSTAWTQDGAILGTASYMAPEQAAGRVRDVGPAVDVYALGAMLYELLTGRPPFRGDSWNQTVDQVLHQEPALPTRLRADLPRDLETVCLKCLEKEPGQRYASARDLATDLERFLDGQPVAAVPLSDADRLARVAARDGYRIVAKVGHGPRSTVHHALYQPLNQVVAIKVYTVGVCTREQWDAQLRQAAGLWAVLADPRIVSFHRSGWWDEAPYLAMEYVPHGSLATKIATQATAPTKGKMARIREAIKLVSHLAETVSYLHRQGVVHGNLRPSNVLLAADDIPRIVDFRPTGGLFQGSLHGPFGPRDDAQALGYLPPELLEDRGLELRPYVDIYGLGTILYELLTCRPPFAAESVEVMLHQVRTQDPVPPSTLNPEVSPHLEKTCLKCLKKDPWRRYVRAYDLAKRLCYFLDNPEALEVIK